MTTDLAIRERDPLDLAPRFVVSLATMREQLRELEEFKRDIMVEGVDYGVIPGTPKPTLLKPGAEKLTLVFGLAPTFVSAGKIEDWEAGFFHYEEECRLVSKRTGEVVATANGSANTREPRYRWRKSERVCPLCGKAAIIRGREEYGGGWVCFKKKDGCGAKFQIGDPEIESQVAGNVENPEPFELVNTVKKMAQKRALVAATLIATGGSGIWTQDVEDMPSVSGGVVEVAPRPAAPANGQTERRGRQPTMEQHERAVGGRRTPAPDEDDEALPHSAQFVCAYCRKVITDKQGDPLTDKQAQALVKRYGELVCKECVDQGAQQQRKVAEQAQRCTAFDPQTSATCLFAPHDGLHSFEKEAVPA